MCTHTLWLQITAILLSVHKEPAEKEIHGLHFSATVLLLYFCFSFKRNKKPLWF